MPAWGPLDAWLREQLPGVPVIDGVTAAVKLCEALHGCGLTTSKAGAFKRPEPKEIVGVGPVPQTVAPPLGDRDPRISQT
ncbi:MAG: allantoin racemase [Pseudonocardiales bacterium]|nr:allantoin racemase [Pseudonocardiales bacterium]